MNRSQFLKRTLSFSIIIPSFNISLFNLKFESDPKKSEFSKKLKPIGRILEEEGYYVWCNTPIYGEDNKVHVFYSRWPEQYGMGGWIHKCEIAHAVADSPESEFRHVKTVLNPREGFFDVTTCHNPHIQKVNGEYCLFYMGNSNSKTNTKRIGLATSKSLNGPWKRMDKPLLETGPVNAWDDHCTTNPAFLVHPNGEYWLYYKSWNDEEYKLSKDKSIRGNRKYGLAIANKINGPYIKHEKNPVIDFSYLGNNEQLEDAFVWFENGKFKLIARDMRVFNHEFGLIFESEDGIHWEEPEIAYFQTNYYFNQPPAPKHLNRYGRFERPQILMKNGKPEYLFTATQGGKYNTASGYILKIS